MKIEEKTRKIKGGKKLRKDAGKEENLSSMKSSSQVGSKERRKVEGQQVTQEVALISIQEDLPGVAVLEKTKQGPSMLAKKLLTSMEKICMSV